MHSSNKDTSGQLPQCTCTAKATGASLHLGLSLLFEWLMSFQVGGVLRSVYFSLTVMFLIELLILTEDFNSNMYSS